MIELLSTIDARVWAKEYMRLYKKFGYEPDEEMMAAWFANAIMTGYDYGYNRCKKEREAVQKHLDIAASPKMRKLFPRRD